ncbi:MAG: hypothetical protein AB198_02300 [Parcubacteria bacterium C7867-003]|nr:MAG: hypothetical protein AB198_02300 [Parcubacteria bacterium C7867-003]
MGSLFSFFSIWEIPHMTTSARLSSRVTTLPDRVGVTAKAKLPFDPIKGVDSKPKPAVKSWRDAPFMVADRESELYGYYRPLLRSLPDFDLIAELSYQMEQVVKLVPWGPFRKGSTRDVFVQKMIARRSSFLQGERLSSEEWEQAFKACIYLWQLWMPRFPRPKQAKAGLTEARKALRQARLKSVPDWELADRLASVVGACPMSDRELEFVGYFWLRIWNLGVDACGISSDYERPRAERLLVEFSGRGRTVLNKKDIATFKEKVGFDPIPLGKVPEVRQLRLAL